MSLDDRRAVPGSPRAQRMFIHACEAAERRGFINFSTPRDWRQDSPVRVPFASGSFGSFVAVEDRGSLAARILRWMAGIVARCRLASDHARRPPHASRHGRAVPRNNLACGIRMAHDAPRHPQAGCGGRGKYRRTSARCVFPATNPAKIF